MKISFHGAARTVTGSKHLVHINNGKKILLDCGMFQGMGKDTLEMNSTWGFEPMDVDHVILSHAHIDHTGLLPKLVKDGYKGKIYCTPATASLAKLLLVDSAHIQEMDVEYINRRREKEGRPLVEPLYTEEDAIKLFSLFETIPYNESYKIEKGIEVMFTDCGHILGSSAVNLSIKEDGQLKTLTFSGDIGRYNDMILRSPATFPQADYIIMESTYGNRLHEVVTVASDKLLRHIQETCIDRQGKMVIPAFSLGRTQEILFLLNRLDLEKSLPDITYYVDSPLSVKVTELIKKYPDYFNADVQKLLKQDDDVFSFSGLKFIETAEDSIHLNDERVPCVIISASGMAEAGRVKHHIANNIASSRNTILMTGYCEPNSLGGRLKQYPHDVKIFGELYPVRAEIAEISSLSAHGDYHDMLHWLSCQEADKVKQIFLVHGEYEVQTEFREKLMVKGFKDVAIPARHQTMDAE
ncbi:MBL fold metallo-hydrolase [Flavipsychrobacter stenotrophus]|uniref:MBL fold metallo-hydrolase n=1 Tax=Flavipsychrobacter stenotrophus TaxID=2077091 RepID=A0A2S7SWJ5_9BACT|nr:MBL fold metallo-hydrolase [Flavipsychrobacter stenotrophus]PQJ11299.1 MBL fold metallo-hydrolase [Flavipsychrobacter stenotrophus]